MGAQDIAREQQSPAGEVLRACCFEWALPDGAGPRPLLPQPNCAAGHFTSRHFRFAPLSETLLQVGPPTNVPGPGRTGRLRLPATTPPSP
jgi:hypothetical protein